jgi:hypothetical protein
LHLSLERPKKWAEFSLGANPNMSVNEMVSGKAASPTPLLVISLFVSLTEVIAGYAVTKATGGVQVALTAFVIAFPSLIALGFFVVLWFKNYVFWPPSEFAAQDVSKYVEAMQRRTIDEERIHTIIRSAVTTAVTESRHSASRETADTGQLVSEITRSALAVVDASVVSVKTEALPGSTGVTLALPYDETRKVHLFLNDIWYAISDAVPPYSYGKSWALRDNATKRAFDVGRPWATRNGFSEDTRSLGEIGISGGAELEVFRPPRKPFWRFGT